MAKKNIKSYKKNKKAKKINYKKTAALLGTSVGLLGSGLLYKKYISSNKPINKMTDDEIIQRIDYLNRVINELNKNFSIINYILPNSIALKIAKYKTEVKNLTNELNIRKKDTEQMKSEQIKIQLETLHKTLESNKKLLSELVSKLNKKISSLTEYKMKSRDKNFQLIHKTVINQMQKEIDQLFNTIESLEETNEKIENKIKELSPQPMYLMKSFLNLFY